MIVLEILISAFEGYIYLSFFSRVFISRIHKLFIIEADIFFALIMYYLRLKAAPPLVFMLSTFAGMIFMTIFYKTLWKSRFAYSSLLAVFGFVSELVSGYLLISFHGVTYEEIAADPRLFIIGVILSKLLHFIIARVTIRVVKRKSDSTPLKHWAGALLIPAVSIAVMHGLAVISDCFLQKDIIVILFCVGGILFLNMTWFTVYDGMVAHTGSELSAQRERGLWLAEESKFDAILRHSKELASHVHDFNHHIGVLHSLMNNGEYSEASNYIGKMTDNLSPLKSAVLYRIINR